MKENKYDDLNFFEKYEQMPRSVAGLSAAGEWHIFQKLMPNLRNKTVLDLGCGFGWHCRYVVDDGAKKVIGVDISTKMLAKAQIINGSPKIEYLQCAIEDIQFKAKSFDFILSSLTFHYVASFIDICKKVYLLLKPQGTFLFSVEHPVFTANKNQQWYLNENETPLFWPIDNYFEEQKITTNFLGENVVKYHRTLTTYINSLILAGFKIEQVIEPYPSKEALATIPEMIHELRRPMMLIIKSSKT